MQCSGTCVDTNTSLANCGGCGRACSGTCANGVCTTTGTGGSTTGTGGGTGGTTAGTAGTGGSTAGTAGTGGTTTGTGGRGGSSAGGTTGGSAAGTGGSGTGGARACAITAPPGGTSADVISDFEEGYAVMIKQGTPMRTGFWYTYSDGTDGQNQTPAKPSSDMADKMLASPSTPCSGDAFHSTATGHPMYVGFGAGFLPMAPPSTSQVKMPYDVSAYDGITFNIKSGSGTPPTLMFEMLTKENQPTASGGNLNIANPGPDSPVGLYNSRLQLLNTASANFGTTYQRVYVPFATLIPRWVPAQGASMACMSGNTPLCQAPPFVPKDVLGIQFSMYGAEPGFPKLGTAGTYDLWVDDVAFYKRASLPAGTSDLPALPTSSVTAMHPFPTNGSVGMCTKPQGIAVDGRFLASAYQQWKARFVAASGSGFKVIRPESNNDTVSEGIAYGMLIAVYMNDKALFDGLWSTHGGLGCAVSSPGCLMTWNNTGGTGSATDADEDSAFALMMASKQWGGGTYATDATNVMHAVLQLETSTAAPYVWGGNNYKSNNSTTNNPSYYAPAWYRAFANFDTTNKNAWNTLADNVYTQLSASNSISSLGLVSAWCNSGCTATATNSGSQDPAGDVTYQYDAHRIPFRVGIDYCWNGTAAAKTFLDKNSGFFQAVYNGSRPDSTGAGIGRILDKYQTGGSAVAGAAPNSASIIGTAAVGAMHSSTYQAFVNDAYQGVFDMVTRGMLAPADSSGKTPYSYFNGTVGLMTLLMMSGNMQSW
jgi:endo-1,4-beta-D-glucanase Y